jgi:hypothetical protein
VGLLLLLLLLLLLQDPVLTPFPDLAALSRLCYGFVSRLLLLLLLNC